MTEGIGDPSRDAVPAAYSHTTKISQRLTPERSAHTSPPQLPSKLGQAPQALADKYGVKSASGPHLQNVRDCASGARLPIWSSTSGPDQTRSIMKLGEADDLGNIRNMGSRKAEMGP